jgi:hypothetical protein
MDVSHLRRGHRLDVVVSAWDETVNLIGTGS